MNGRINENMDPSLRKRLADLEIRRKTLIEAMSKFQDAKKSALFQYLNENSEEELLSSSRYAGEENERRSEVRNSAVRQDTSEDRDHYCSRRDSIPDIRHDSCSKDPRSHTELYKPREEKSRSLCAEEPSLTPTSLTARCLEGTHRSTGRSMVFPEDKAQQKSKLFPEKTDWNYTIDGNDPNLDSSNTRRAPYSERLSLVESDKRQTYLSKRTTSYKIILQQFDTDSTDTIENSLLRTKKKYPKELFQAPSDESTSYDDNGDNNIVPPLLDKNRTTTETSIFQDQHENIEGNKYFRNDQSIRARSKGDTLVALKNNNTSLKLTNLEEEYPIFTREVKENNMSCSKSEVDPNEDKTHTASSKLIYPEALDRQGGMDDVVTRSTTNNICKDKNMIRNEPGGKYEMEEIFLKLFVYKEEGIPTKLVGERKFVESERTPHNDKISLDDPSEELRGRVRKDIRVGCEAKTTKENVTDVADNDYDHMSLLEKKLNLMISKKPLWQKALEDLYDEPFSSNVSESATSSGITKPPSKAETICYIDTPSTTGPTATDFRRHENQKKNVADADSSADIKVGTKRVQAGNNTNNGDSVAETDTIESWHIQSICSIDSPSIIVPTATDIHHQENEKNHVDSKAYLTVGKYRTEAGNSMDDGDSAAEINTIESWHIQNAKNYLDTLPECLSNLHESSTNGEKSKAESKIENECFGNAQIEVEIESLRTAESEYTSPLVEEQMVLTHTGQQFILTTSLQSHQSSMIGEKSKVESEIKKNRVENARKEFHLGSLRIAKSEDNIASPNKEQIVLRHAEQQYTHSLYLQSNQQKETKIESPRAIKSKDIIAPLDEQQMVSTRAEELHDIETLFIQSNQQKEVDIEPPRTTESQYVVVSQDEEQMVSTHVEQQTTYLQSNPRKEATIESPRIAQSNDIKEVDEGQIFSTHNKQQHIQSVYLQSNQWEMISPAAHLKTPPVSNTKELFFLESDKVGDANMLQLQKGTPRQSCSESDVFGDIDLLSQDQNATANYFSSECDNFGDTNLLQDQNVTNLSNCFDWGVTSDLSEDSNVSLGCSSSTVCSSEKINNHDVDNDGDIENDGENENDDDGVGEQDSEESSMKPPIPNEVTMLTDFTVQSVTFTSNNSIIESLGEESLAQEIQPNGQSARYVMSSNSESTIIGEKRNTERKEGALKAMELKMSCTEGLMKILKTTSLLCQCTGPVM